ncbi:MAG: hypothetical protein RQ847_07700 [Wenzhouxiangellaceae bacterium]|nr:hypothetical protein [Wenzhouxiangellaceae bacterium]
MNTVRRSRPGPAWLLVNLALVVLACLAWGWLDWRYVTGYWTAAEMAHADDGLWLAIPILALLANLWLLRRQPAVLHLSGALASAFAVTAAWWLIIRLAAEPFHLAIGGTPAS